MSSNSELARSHRHLNVHPLERLISIGIGACMMQSGLQRSGVGGALRLLAGGALAYRGLRGHCPLYEAYDIDTRSGHSTEMSREWQSIEASVLVSRPPNELYRTWRDFTRMPSLLSHVEKVEILDDQRSRWTVIGPMNARLDLVSRVDDDQQDRRIAWRSTPQASVETEGAVEFLPEGAGATRVKVHLSYRPPAAASAGSSAGSSALTRSDGSRKISAASSTAWIWKATARPLTQVPAAPLQAAGVPQGKVPLAPAVLHPIKRDRAGRAGRPRALWHR